MSKNLSESSVTCPACGAEQDSSECNMGTLGNRMHCRCRYCGAGFSHVVRGRKPSRPRVEAMDDDDDEGDWALPGDIAGPDGKFDFMQAVQFDLNHCTKCHGEIDADEVENLDGVCRDCKTDEGEGDELERDDIAPPDDAEGLGLEPTGGDEKIKLHDIGGVSRKSGNDDDGNKWIQFEVDYNAEQEPGECSICGAELESGWMCLDGGEEVCDDHVDMDEEDEG